MRLFNWRDYFPFLRWIPNKSLETKIQGIYSRRKAVMKSLINEQKKRIDSGEEVNCFVDFLLSEAKTLSSTLTMEQITMLVWEIILETTDTTLVTTEWAMYQLGKELKILSARNVFMKKFEVFVDRKRLVRNTCPSYHT